MEEVIAGQPIAVGEITVLPIIRTLVSGLESKQGMVCSALKDVVVIVVASPQGTRAINTAGEEVPLEHYAEHVPEVRELLEST